MRLALLVDLDGTIVDTLDWHRKIASAVEREICITLPDRAYASFASFIDCLELNPKPVQRAFWDEYNRRVATSAIDEEVGVYSDSVRFLESFAYQGRALITNRPRISTIPLLRHLHLDALVDSVACAIPGVTGKPDTSIGMSVLRTVGHYTHVAVVGDTVIDMDFAHNLSKILHVPVQGFLVDRIRYFNGRSTFGQTVEGLDEVRVALEELLQRSKQ